MSRFTPYHYASFRGGETSRCPNLLHPNLCKASREVVSTGFTILARDGRARLGRLETAHGEVLTPVYMPVGTQGSVKALAPDDLRAIGAQIILGNTYHLYLRPGHQFIKRLGGLHRFMGWSGPILTDSGGFQAFSLGAMIEHGVRKVGKQQIKQQSVSALVTEISDRGVEFRSHLDGSKHLLTPEKSIEIQLSLGADICLGLDELLSPLNPPEYVGLALKRTHRWMARCQTHFKKQVKRSINQSAQFFGIMQGVYDQKIRENEAKWVAKQNYDGIGIGGSFGTSRYWGKGELDWAETKAIYQTMDWVVPWLPEELPRHGLGIGEVVDLFECVERGIDMFDCVAATRRARNGSLYVSRESGGNKKTKFVMTIGQTQFATDRKPIDKNCQCYCCQNFSRAYLRHLYLSGEILYHRLASIHNVYFMVNLTNKIRAAIVDKKLAQLKQAWLD